MSVWVDNQIIFSQRLLYQSFLINYTQKKDSSNLQINVGYLIGQRDLLVDFARSKIFKLWKIRV